MAEPDLGDFLAINNSRASGAELKSALRNHEDFTFSHRTLQEALLGIQYKIQTQALQLLNAAVFLLHINREIKTGIYPTGKCRMTGVFRQGNQL